MQVIFDKFKLAPRFALAFGLVILVTSLAAATGIWRLESLRAIADELGGASSQRALLARELHAIVVISSFRAETLLQVDDAAFVARVNADRKATSARSEQVRKALDELTDDDETRNLFKKIDTNGAAFRKVRDALVKRKEQGQPVTAQEIQTQLRPVADDYAKAVDELAEYQARRVKEAREAASRNTREGVGMLIIGVGVGLVISLWSAWALARSIVRPLSRASRLVDQVAAGDMSAPQLRVDGQDEVSALLRGLGTMQDKLSGLVAQVQQTSESISASTSEIALGNQDLSSRTEHAAANLQETSSSTSQLMAKVNQSADSARQANALSVSASDVAKQGGQAMTEVVSTMDDIARQSSRIADITGVIDGIAFQTNILALNAAVEAARAGEQGRGFAVVAAEVRTLAQRSAQAAREIKALIGESVAKVEAGSRQVAVAGSTMSGIVDSVQKVSDVINNISAATTEQRADIGRLSESVAQLDDLTQQNAALAEQSTAATQSLKQQVELLARAVSTFRIAPTARALAYNA